MKVILNEDVPRIGKKGEIVNVKQGYYRNFLVPKNLAVIADKENLAKWEEQQEKLRKEEEINRNKAKENKEKIEATSVSIKVKAGEEGKLFGSITNKDIAKALAEKNIEVDKKKVEGTENISSLGDYEVNIKLYPEIQAKLKVKVEAE